MLKIMSKRKFTLICMFKNFTGPICTNCLRLDGGNWQKIKVFYNCDENFKRLVLLLLIMFEFWKAGFAYFVQIKKLG